jgi:CheY-like chemotaxis protein
MSDEVKQHLFEPFFTTKEVGKGTGLGLAMCFGIIKQAGGDIVAYSEVGRGTTFKILLPRVTASLVEPAPAPPSVESPLHGSETVLLVEDERVVRRVAARVLRGLGYTVIESGSGQEALAASSGYADSIDLLLTDVVMPGMSGNELAQRIAAERPSIRVLFTSGYTDDAVFRHGVIEHGLSFLQKPFSAGALTRKVREVLDAPPHAERD